MIRRPPRSITSPLTPFSGTGTIPAGRKPRSRRDLREPNPARGSSLLVEVSMNGRSKKDLALGAICLYSAIFLGSIFWSLDSGVLRGLVFTIQVALYVGMKLAWETPSHVKRG